MSIPGSNIYSPGGEISIDHVRYHTVKGVHPRTWYIQTWPIQTYSDKSRAKGIAASITRRRPYGARPRPPQRPGKNFKTQAATFISHVNVSGAMHLDTDRAIDLADVHTMDVIDGAKGFM